MSSDYKSETQENLDNSKTQAFSNSSASFLKWSNLITPTISVDKDAVMNSALKLMNYMENVQTILSDYDYMVSVLEELSSKHDNFLGSIDFSSLRKIIEDYFTSYNRFVMAVKTKNLGLIKADDYDFSDKDIGTGEVSSIATVIGASSSIGGGGTSGSTGGGTSTSSDSSSDSSKKKKKKKNNNNSDAEDSEELVDESEDIENEKIDDEPVDADEVFGELDDSPTEGDSQKEESDTQNNDTSKTPDTSTPSDNQNETSSTPSQNTTPQETPSDNSTTPTPSHSLNQQGTASSGSDNYHSGGGYSSSDGYSDTVSTSPEGTDGITDVTESPIEVLDDAPTSIEDVIKDNYTKIPSSSEPITSSTSKGKGTIIPVIAGLSAATAAGIGAKAYLDRKQNNENDEVEELETDDWSGEEKLDLEYDDNKVPVAYLDDDDDEEEDTMEEQQPERYDAKTNEELADLQ